MSQFRALVVSSPGSRGEKYFSHALQTVGFDAEVLDVFDLVSLRLDHEQLCLKYKLVIFPGGNTFANALGAGKVLALKVIYDLGWNLTRFAERGGLVLGVANGFQTLLHLKVFGKEFAYRMNEEGQYKEGWIKATPAGNRCIWLRGLGTMELPINQLDTEFVIDPFAYIEAKGRLERMGLGCLKEEGSGKIMGMCDPTGHIFGLLPHPEFFLSWTNMEDWYVNPTRAAAPGHGFALFENAAKYVTGE